MRTQSLLRQLRRRPQRVGSERGFTLIEVVIALFITIEVILGALALFDFHNKLARIQTQISDMQQSLRVAQYDMVRMTRMAGRGGFPAVMANGAWGAVSVRSNVTSANDDIAINFSGSPKVVDGTDVLTLRGVFSSSVFQVNPYVPSLTLNPATPTTATSGSIVVCAYTGTGVAQNLPGLIASVNAEKTLAQTDALILVSPVNDALYTVVELDPTNSVLNQNQAQCTVPSGVVAPNPTGVVLAFRISGDSLANSFAALGPAPAGGLPPPMSSVAWLGILEEYRYYVRRDLAQPTNPNSDPAPHLSRARMFPGTETPYQGDKNNLQADIADGILDLQVSLGVDKNGDGAIQELGKKVDDDEWLGNFAAEALTPPGGALREVRISTLAKTGNPDFQYLGPTVTAIEDHPYTGSDFANNPHGRAYRHRLLQTVVGLRNL